MAAALIAMLVVVLTTEKNNKMKATQKKQLWGVVAILGIGYYVYNSFIKKNNA